MQVKLVVYVINVVAYGLGRNKKRFRNLLIAEPYGNQPEYFLLTFGQPFEVRFRSL